MRYRVMEAEQKKKPGSVLRQNTQVTAPGGHKTSPQWPKNLLTAQAGLGNRYVQRIVAQIKEGRDSKGPQPLQTNLETMQGGERDNHTGLPDQLKLGVEQLSGYSLDDVRVHYNSSKPAKLQALAYTQGANIYVAPGQERHLPHEAWHVVQQAQGRVRPTFKKDGVAVNDDQGLEYEADVRGAMALGMRTPTISTSFELCQAKHGEDSQMKTLSAESKIGLLKSLSSQTIQGKWMFVVKDPGRGNRAGDQYYWLNDGDGPEPALAPGIARRLKLTRLSAPPQAGFSYPEDQYTTLVSGGNQGSSRSNKYNPFGRFNSNLTMSAYLPRENGPDFTGISEEHGEIIESGGDSGTFFPVWVVTEQSRREGKRLNLIAADPFGATYGDGPAMLPGARFQISKQIRAPSGIPQKARPILTNLHEQSVNALEIDQGVITGYKGGRDSEDGQKKIMGVSADEMARAAGYDSAVDPEYENDQSKTGRQKHGWEWLHMVSYALGGPTANGPQIPTNLVVGTTAANTAMIMIEDAINSFITKKVVKKANVHVKPIMANEEYRIASTLIYSVTFELNDGHILPMLTFNFSALSNATPYEATNRYFRAMLKHQILQYQSQLSDDRPEPMEIDYF